MKYVVILGDGMADLPNAELNGKTPLAVAHKPNIDKCAKVGLCGVVKTVPNGMKPGSDVANIAMMGYAPEENYTGRSPLEALSIGVNMESDDIAVRANLVTLSSEPNYANKTMVDYSAGEISTEEAKILIQAVDNALGNELMKFYAGVSYRHCLIVHNTNIGTNLTPPHDISGKVIGQYLPKGNNGNLMLELMEKSYGILINHPINIERIKQGKNPANSIWLWGEGTKPSMPSFNERYGKNGAVISAVDLLKGIGIASKMQIIDVPNVTGTLHTNFDGKAKACVDALNSGIDYVYLHMEAPDECGHQGDLSGKIKSIELIDEKVVGYILKELEGTDFALLIAPDHPTPISLKTHTSVEVPFVIYNSKKAYNGINSYTEENCINTGLYYSNGVELTKMFFEQ